MTRLNRSYIVPQPIEPLNLEEIKFWLRIMQEHAWFIKAGLPCDCGDLIDEAQSFYQELEVLRMRAEKVQNDKKFVELVNDAYSIIKDLHHFKHLLLDMMLHCKLGGFNFPLQLDHTAREAEYALRLLEKIKEGKILTAAGSKAYENVFWLRIMADHTKFIAHLLDPSERLLIEAAQSYSTEFDGLYLQGQDFAGMLHRDEVPSFKRFLQDVRVATLRLRDYKKATHDMIESCRLVGVISGLMADHVRREADHFLLILAMLEKGLMKTIPLEESCEMAEEFEPDIETCDNFAGIPGREHEDVAGEEETEEIEAELPVEVWAAENKGTEKEHKPHKNIMNIEPPPVEEPLPADETADKIEDLTENKAIEHKYNKNTVKMQSPAVEEAAVSTGKTAAKAVGEDAFIDSEPPKPLKEPKYKWGGKLPRKLGK